MGASQSQTGTRSATIVGGGRRGLLGKAYAAHRREHGYVGGGAGEALSYFDGNDAADPAKGLREYGRSLGFAAKERVIRKLARAMAAAGIKVDPEGDLDDIVSTLASEIPNPGRNGKTFAAQAKAQAAVCKTIARVLNDEYSPGASSPSDKLIDPTLSPETTCRMVSEVVHSFVMGVNTEYLETQASVRNILTVLSTLREIMRESWSKIQNEVASARDSELSGKISELGELYGRAQQELDRQLLVLGNILHSTLPKAAETLQIALMDDTNKLIKQLGLKPGSGEMADLLAKSVSGLGSAAAAAHRVSKALKEAGIEAEAYLASPDRAALRRLLDAQTTKTPSKNLAEVIKAGDTLMKTFDQRGEMRDLLKTGGAEAPEDKGPIARRVERSAAEKKLILRDFAERIGRQYDELLAAVRALAPALGGAIPLSEHTDALRDALAALNAARSGARIELALIGAYVDAAARARKEQYLSALQVVSTACDRILALSGYQGAAPLIARLKAAIDGIRKTVDYFSDVVKTKFGGDSGEGDDDNPMADASGGAPEDIPELARSGLSLAESVREFTYFYYVARVRTNLTQTSKELESYGEKYSELLGDAVAERLRTLEAERKTFKDLATDALRKELTDATGILATAVTAGTLHNDAKVDTDIDKWWTAVKAAVDSEYDIKARFYRALQAVDLYMQAFTSAIANDPGAVKDIKKALDGTPVIARWFSEKTGDSICSAFDQMGSTNFKDARGLNVLGLAAAKDGGHYYEKIAKGIAAAAAANVGVPQVSIRPDGERADMAQKKVGEAMSHFQALKNLVSAFAHIGDKFGGRELASQIFMSPTQIYKILADYMRVSALSLRREGLAGSTASTVAAAPKSINFVSETLGATASTVGAVQPLQLYFGSVEDTMGGRYVVEDRYFVAIIKAMAAKIMTVVGVYDMFERTAPLESLTETRMIIGGGDEDFDPEVIEGASELYFRLPRLAEFYRDLFGWETAGTEELRVAMLPELEGVFAGLIRQIFQKVVAPGDYSDGEVRTLIREINAVYEHYRGKKPDAACHAALTGFVAEVNRRYGLIKKTDMDDYLKMVKQSRSGIDDFANQNETDFLILPGEGSDEADRRAPSDRYAGPAGAAVLPASRVALDTEYDKTGRRSLLRSLRTKLDKKFTEAKGKYGKTSFSLLIKQAEAEISRASARDARYLIAARLIQGKSIVGLDVGKSLMFHETVVVGLNTLSAIESLLRGFSAQLDAMDPVAIEGLLMDTILANSVAGGTNVLVTDWATLRGGLARATSEAFAAMVERYVVPDSVPSFYARGNLEAAAVPKDVYTMIDRLNVAIKYFRKDAAEGLSDVPSKFTAEDPTTTGTSTGVGEHNARLATIKLLRLAARLLTNYPLIMKDFLEQVFDLSSSGLVETRFVGNKIQLGFGRLREVAESLLADVKFFFDALRPSLSDDTIKRFESVDNPGSVFWLEKHLVDVFFREAEEAGKNKTLDGIARRTSSLFDNLTRETFVTLGTEVTHARLDLAAAALASNDAAGAATLVATYVSLLTKADATKPTRFETYGTALSELVFYGTVDNIKTLAMKIDTSGAGLSQLHLLATKAHTTATNNTPLLPALGDSEAAAFPLYSNADGTLPEYRSLMFAFNQLVAGYLQSMLDVGGQKIYANLINSYANGVASQSVAVPPANSFPDVARSLISTAANGATAQFGVRGDPKSGAILFQSLAWVLQRIVKDTNPTTNAPYHLLSTLTDTPLHIKETMRVSLPGYVKLFDLLSQKGDFLKQLMQKTSIKVDRQSQLVATEVLYGAGVAGGVVTGTDITHSTFPVFIAYSTSALAGAFANGNATFQAAIIYEEGVVTDDESTPKGSYDKLVTKALHPLSAALSNIDMRARLIGVIDAVASGSYALSSAAAEVLRELGDNPAYLQVGDGSDETYKMRYGKAPMAPLSLALWALEGGVTYGSPWTDVRLYPGKPIASPEFKMAYGLRQLLARATPVGFEQVPGVRAALDLFNSSAVKQERLDETRYLRFVKTVVSALRYLADTRNYKGVLSGQYLPAGQSLLYAQPAAVLPGAAAGLIAASAVNGAHTSVNGIVVPDGTDATKAKANAAYPIGTQTPEILSVVESSNQENESEKIAGRIGQASNESGDRKTEQVLNLVDMNIIPVNVHALMREIPLANLYNYECTMEQMVCSLFGEQSPKFTGPGGLIDAETRTTRDMFIRLLVDPFTPVSPANYGSDVLETGTGGFVHRMFRGNNNLGMGRPKMLSDQIFGKALFGSVYRSTADSDEAGPAAGSALARGRDLEAGSVKRLVRDAYRELKTAADIITAPWTELSFEWNRMVSGGPSAINDMLHVTVIAVNTLLRSKNGNIKKITQALATISATAGNVATISDAAGLLEANLAFMAGMRARFTTLIGSFAKIKTSLENAKRLVGASSSAATAAIDSIITKIDTTLTILKASAQPNATEAAAEVAAAAATAAPIDSPANRLTSARIVVGTTLATGGNAAAVALAVTADQLVAHHGMTPAAFATPADDVLASVSEGTPTINANAVLSTLQAAASSTGAGDLPQILLSLDFKADPAKRIDADVGKLTFIKAAGAGAGTGSPGGAPEAADVKTADIHAQLEAVGYARFNTRFVRKLMFVTNIVRTLRLKLSRELTQSRSVIAKSHAALAPELTEYGFDPYGPNEVYGSMRLDGQTRFADG